MVSRELQAIDDSHSKGDIKKVIPGWLFHALVWGWLMLVNGVFFWGRFSRSRAVQSFLDTIGL
ncbi:MAG: hypothetical protein GF350_14440 [Chitinivibrionales bacterium]|nr:hypothetical protein [Chitinivibrionales bacterium]